MYQAIACRLSSLKTALPGDLLKKKKKHNITINQKGIKETRQDQFEMQLLTRARSRGPTRLQSKTNWGFCTRHLHEVCLITHPSYFLAQPAACTWVFVWYLFLIHPYLIGNAFARAHAVLRLVEFSESVALSGNFQGNWKWNQICYWAIFTLLHLIDLTFLVCTMKLSAVFIFLRIVEKTLS